MRRSLLAVPVVLALGAGGYVIFHGGSHAVTSPPAAHPATTVTTRDGRVIDLAAVHSGVAPATQAGSSGAPGDPTATAALGSGAAASTVSAAVASDPATGSGSNAAAANGPVPPVMPAADVARFEQTHGRGATKTIPVPVRGSQKLQKHLGAMANCQGPEYATLTGQARVDYANRCAKAGVNLPP